MASMVGNIMHHVNLLSVIPQRWPDNNRTPNDGDSREKQLIFVRKQTASIVKDMVNNFRDAHFDCSPSNKYSELMRKMVIEVNAKYRISINKNVELIMNEVNKSDDNYTVVNALGGVISSMSEDKKMFHWGRLTIIFTMVAVLVQYQRKRGIECCCKQFSKMVLEIFKEEKIDIWILDNGGWDKFIENYEGSNYESKLRTAFYLTALGLGALASINVKW